MANSSEFNGHGLAMRNGHAKSARPIEGRRGLIAHAEKPEDKRLGSKKPRKPLPTAAPRATRGVRFERRYTTAGTDPLDAVVYERRSSTITNPDGSVVFKMDGAEVPASWSQLATDIAISKYFRKAGIHGDKDIGETSVRQLVHRLAHTIRVAAEKQAPLDPSRKHGAYFAT